MGGYGVFDLVSNRPKIFAAAAQFVEVQIRLTSKCYEVPFWIFHGDMDRLFQLINQEKLIIF